MNTQPDAPVAMMVDGADLQQLVELAGIFTSARDAMSDDIVNRVSLALSEGMALLDRFARNQGLMRLIQVLDHPDTQKLLIGLSDALRATSRDIARSDPAEGGLGELLRMARDPATLEGIRILGALGQHLSDSLRVQNGHGR